MRKEKKSRHVLHFIEGIAFWGFFLGHFLIPMVMRSVVGRCFAHFIGLIYPKIHRVAMLNLKKIFPHETDDFYRRISRSSLENSGMVVSEYTCLQRLKCGQHFKIYGQQHLERLQYTQQPIIFFSAHLANFQIITLAIRHFGIPIAQIYHKASNPWSDQLVQWMQKSAVDAVFHKNKKGIRAALQWLKSKKSLFLLIDHHAVSGEPLLLLGHRAKTFMGLVKMARKTRAICIPAHVVRKNGSFFDVHFHAPLDVQGDDKDVMQKANDMVSNWIYAHPEQWMWIHDRWKFSSTKNSLK